jgi:O-antigen/teichoic acid export membrane protein
MAQGQIESEVPVAAPGRTQKGRMLRNTLFLVLSQFVSAPLSMVINAVLARKLGAEDFGTIYLASTMAALGFLFVDWGQTATITQRVALRNLDVSELIGTSFALKSILVVATTIVLAGIAWALGYSRAVFLALGLTIVQQIFISLTATYTAVMRGIERLDWVSGLTVAGNLMMAALVIPAALLGGGLSGTLAAQAFAALFTLFVTSRLLAREKLPPPRATREMGRTLMKFGGSFVLFNIVLALQPYVDAVILSRLSSTEAVGWYAAARRFLGLLIFPATTVGFVLYPNMSRLWHEDKARFTNLLRMSLRLVITVGVCASMGTYLFAGFAINVLYSNAGFGPAIADLQVLAAFIFLLYFTLILGAGIAASGKQFPWAIAQIMCVVVSAIGDPFLVPYCERHYGNGGLGVCIAAVISEVFMLTAALVLMRKEKLLAALASAALPALAGATGMWLVARGLRNFPAPLGMACCVMVYAVLVVALGGVDRAHLALIKDVVRSKRRSKEGS